ncbi:Fc.00g010720.m01.CDS01 [Cosmosporella sp. VM-42]
MSPSEPPKLIIIGAGLAGLSLAQGLKYANPHIPFHIFERDTSASFRAQGYRIRITPDGAAGLRKLLPNNLWELFEATSGKVIPGGGSRLDAISGKAVHWNRPEPKGNHSSPSNGKDHPPPQFHEGKAYNADRSVLRNLLLDGLDEHISFDKRFESYTIGTDGSVSVTFADGSSEHGAVLIGADGTRSAVRHQLLPDLTVLDTEGRAIFGKTFLTPGIFEKVPPELFQGLTLIGETQESHIKLFCDPMQFDQTFNTGASTQFMVPADYIYWVLCFRSDVLSLDDATFLSLSRRGSVDQSLDLTSRWHSTIGALLKDQDKDSASTIAFLTCDAETFDTQWKSFQRRAKEELIPVTLLGDAAHPMSPVGGVGANTAFQEAADLCKTLIQAFKSTKRESMANAFITYQEVMTTRATAIVRLSATGAGHFFGMKAIEALKPAVL